MSNEPILFLDVDGVLNSIDQLDESRRFLGMAPMHVAALARILAETDAKVVVSSAWRIGGIGPGSRFWDELSRHGANGELVLRRVVDKTDSLWNEAPDKQSVRGFEIQSWREKNGHAGPFVIVDDDSDMGPLKPHLVKTTSQRGLTPAIANQIIRRFRRESILREAAE